MKLSLRMLPLMIRIKMVFECFQVQTDSFDHKLTRHNAEAIRAKLLETSLEEKTKEVEEANEKLQKLRELEEELSKARARIAEQEVTIISLKHEVITSKEESGRAALELKLAEVSATLEERTKVLDTVRAELKEKVRSFPAFFS